VEEEEIADADDEADITDAAEAAAEGTSPTPAAPSTSDTAQVQFMVTRRMQARLAQLGYSQSESEVLAPERAAAIIERSIRRPAGGVPAAWKRGARGSPGGFSILNRCGKAIASGGGRLKAAIPAICLAPLVWHVSQRKPAAKRVALAPVAALITPPSAPAPPLAPGEYWLDRQFDRFIDWLTLQIAKMRK